MTRTGQRSGWRLYFLPVSIDGTWLNVKWLEGLITYHIQGTFRRTTFIVSASHPAKHDSRSNDLKAELHDTYKATFGKKTFFCLPPDVTWRKIKWLEGQIRWQVRGNVREGDSTCFCLPLDGTWIVLRAIWPCPFGGYLTLSVWSPVRLEATEVSSNLGFLAIWPLVKSCLVGVKDKMRSSPQ